MCHVNLDGWESGDDAATEHYAHRPECAAAINGYVEKMFKTPGQSLDHDPMSEKYRTARLQSFQDMWPHENKRAWKPKSVKLAEAGWYFEPEIGGDDGAACLYCDESVFNWEPKDDP